MLTTPNNLLYLNREQGTDFLLPKWAFSRRQETSVSCSYAERSPFYLEGEMPSGIYLRTEGHCINIGKALKGKTTKEETYKRLGKYMYKKGHPPSYKGKGLNLSKKCLNCNKEFYVFPCLKKKLFCSAKCFYTSSFHKNNLSKVLKGRISPNKGIPMSEGQKKKNSIALIKHYDLVGRKEKRPKHLYWQYDHWTKKVFERDYYTCQKCGNKKTELNAHHIKSFAKYPEIRYEVSNGITLCEDCHKEIHRKIIVVH